jgi:hypothetical protein
VSYYRTEVVIPPDRYVCLQLPPRFPEGKATITVLVQESATPEAAPEPENDADHQDIEWWDEFEDDDEGPG